MWRPARLGAWRGGLGWRMFGGTDAAARDPGLPHLSALAPAMSAIILVAAIVVRLPGLFGDLWLDEIWSLRLAQRISTPFDIITAIHHDNNHHLNTLFLYMLQGTGDWYQYRLLSLATGVGSVVVMALIARRWGLVEGLAASMLGGFSYLLVQYSSEARGYAAAAFFGLACAYLLLRWGEARLRLPVALFWACAMLGFLSHLTFLHAYLALLTASAARILGSRGGRSKRVVQALVWHAVPLCAFALLYLVDVRHMQRGGGPIYGVTQVLRETLMFTFGVPNVTALVMVVAALVMAAAIIELMDLWQRAPVEGTFFTTAVALAPVAFMVYGSDYVLYPRYFLVIAPFVLLLASRALARCFRDGVAGRVLCIGLLLMFIGGNGVRLVRFARDGRGAYRDAVAYMATHTLGSVITVGSDHDFRNPMVLRYYAESLPPERSLEYIGTMRSADRFQWSGAPPAWYIRHDFGDAGTAPDRITVNGDTYLLAQTYGYYGLSGWSWLLYRRADLASEAGPSP